MSEYVIPTDDEVDVGVTLAVDPEYDYEAEQGHATIAFKQGALGLIMGIAKAGRRLALRLDGFTPNIRNVVGSAVSFRQGNVIVTYQVNRRRVKERIRFLANPNRDRFTFTAIITDGVHLEAMGDGGIQVVDDATGRVPMRMLPPDIVDNNGRAGTARYELAADGRTITLVLDLAWLAQAAYPVTIDPTTITSTSIGISSLEENRAPHVFRMADASLVAIWVDTSGAAGNLKRSRSTDAGASWGAAASPFASLTVSGGVNISATHDRTGDVIYGLFPTTESTQKYGRVFKMAFSGGTFTDSSAPTDELLGGGHPDNPAGARMSNSAVWDSVFSRLLIVYGWQTDTTGTGQTVVQFYFEAWNGAAMTVVTSYGLVNEDVNSGAGSVGIACDTSNPVVVFVSWIRSGTWIRVTRWTWSGSGLLTAAPGTRELSPAISSGLSYTCDTYINPSGELECFYTDNGALKTLRRTGTDTFSASTTLVSSGVVDSGAGGNTVSVTRVANAGDDVYVLYRWTGGQANGEIYYIKRTSGVWGSATLLAGGANTGWRSPSSVKTIYSVDNFVYLLYLTGNSPYTLVFSNTIRAGSAPLTPTNILPAGVANTTLTPTVGGRYLNGNASDPMSAYRILVTRQSDSVVMWDTGKTTYSGSAITNGMDYSRAYAGTALAKNVTYLMQIKFWDNWGDLEGPYNAAQSFVINDAPVVTITSSAAPATSGPTVTWTYSQTHSHAQASYKVRLLNPNNGAVVYDSGTIASAATSHGIPSGTLQNGVTYTLEVTATSTDGL